MQDLRTQPSAPQPLRAGIGLLAALWGVTGVLLLLGQASWRLGAVALEALRQPGFTPAQTVLLAVWIVASAYLEGYRAFHQQFAPRVVARALYLSAHPRPLWVALAPLFCMALFHATRRRLITSWTLVVAVMTMVILVRRLPQPWRGIVDAGVVIALVWGITSVLLYSVRGWMGQPMPVPSEVPESPERADRSPDNVPCSL